MRLLQAFTIREIALFPLVDCLEPTRGLEPLTYALRVRCSTS